MQAAAVNAAVALCFSHDRPSLRHFKTTVTSQIGCGSSHGPVNSRSDGALLPLPFLFVFGFLVFWFFDFMTFDF